MDWSGHKHLLIFGGSFDPPHRAHIELPGRVRETLGADTVVYIPAGRAPHKLDREQAEPAHRLAMTHLAVADDPHAVVLPIEIERNPGEPSYTVHTLETLRTMLDPDAVMRLLIGVDQMLIFDQWYQADRIIELAEPVVMLRPPETADSALAALPPDADHEAWQARLVDVPLIDLSSSDLRRRVARGQSIVGDVPDTVADYIARHGLYRE